MVHTPLYSPTDQGICAGLSLWGTAPSCVSGSITRASTTPPFSPRERSPTQHGYRISIHCIDL
eukprot:4053392-Prymnesium_polylepis.1